MGMVPEVVGRGRPGCVGGGGAPHHQGTMQAGEHGGRHVCNGCLQIQGALQWGDRREPRLVWFQVGNSHLKGKHPYPPESKKQSQTVWQLGDMQTEAPLGRKRPASEGRCSSCNPPRGAGQSPLVMEIGWLPTPGLNGGDMAPQVRESAGDDGVVLSGGGGVGKRPT